MAKHKKEIEVEFPDCDVCGRDIGTGEYLELEVQVKKRHYVDSGASTSSYRASDTLSICERCISHPEIWKQKLFEVVDEAVNQRL